ncbi:Wzz/FepE/Etk N-terminal domain-containing protein [Pseudomonas gingeri]|uniref:Polysaccharide chain length determinant N-terminal domain-containing protein n=1 Tax=Pseudomonas gingeri TaxID=117681 RepID=A0A7Y7YBV9_9PSED|nr:Wzz/FepE/Etk N-terminal domain-containing protein [Pseudomonas gingeri]NWB25376.1 hypothetical protein [Pseudomonas gingeri]NWC33417.1 hypothetical protein [Pseudomonas gingeri]
MSTQRNEPKTTPEIYKMEEINFSELFQYFWQKKALILSFVISGFIIAAAAAYSIKPVYQTSALIIPPSIAGLGDLVQVSDTKTARDSNAVLAQALEFSEGATEVLKRNLMSEAMVQKFKERNSQAEESLSIHVSEDRLRCKSITLPDSRMACNSVMLTVSGVDRLKLKPALDAYLHYVAALTAVEINEFMTGMGLVHRYDESGLYRVERASVVPDTPIRPRKILIFILGAFLGGAVGVIVVIARDLFGRNESGFGKKNRVKE